MVSIEQTDSDVPSLYGHKLPQQEMQTTIDHSTDSGATPFEWTQLFLDWGIEAGVAIVVPIVIAYIYSKKKSG